ncbi:hypothetical protein [Pseudoalteromonas phenolica]|uniref:hypothetical protein n=1 Tax=Pseudoalteromonas phenolica TaxID=161398 RepID=UPI00110BA056|nr:hypothetical protein [Pseudoalteromonas phenolica]TMO54095.1 hypothetical protein CWC21_16550 [Pseudoalteromonas phenolica]
MQDNRASLGEASQIQDLKALNAEEQSEEQKLTRLTESADVSMNRIPIFALVLTAVLFGYYLSSFTSFFPLTGEAENWGELRGQFGALGDFFGGLLNPVLSFCTIVLLIFSLRVQMGELSLSRKELKRTRLAHEQQLKDAKFAANSTNEYQKTQIENLEHQLITMIEQAGDSKKFQDSQLANFRQQSSLLQIQSRIALDQEKNNKQKELELQLVRMLDYQRSTIESTLKNTGLTELNHHERKNLANRVNQLSNQFTKEYENAEKTRPSSRIQSALIDQGMKLAGVTVTDKIYVRQVELLNQFHEKGLRLDTLHVYCENITDEIYIAITHSGSFKTANYQKPLFGELVTLENTFKKTKLREITNLTPLIEKLTHQMNQ